MRDNQSHIWDNLLPKQGSNYGAIEPITKRYTDIPTTSQPTFNYPCSCSQSLQRLIEQKPSILVYLVLLSSTFFLTILIMWSGRIFAVAHLKDIATEKTAVQNNSVNLSSVDNLQAMLESFIYSPSRQNASLEEQRIPIKSKKDNSYNQEKSIILGTIKSNFPDIYFGDKNILFYHLSVNSEKELLMDNTQNFKLKSIKMMTINVQKNGSMEAIEYRIQE